MKKTLRSIVTVVLVLTMSLGIFSAAASAGAEKKKSYVALGDSFSQGYMFHEYVDGNNGYGQSIERSYVNKFAKVLGDEYELTDLTIHGMRPATLYNILVPELMTEPDWDVTGHIEGYTDGAPFTSLDGMTKKYRESIKDAELITFDLGIGDFGIFAVNTLMELMDPEPDEGFRVPSAAQFIDKLDKESAAFVELLRGKLHEILEENFPDAPIADIIETLVYAYVNFIVYFDKCADYIYTVNPDVELIVLPLFNPLSDLYLSVDGMEQPINVSLLFDAVMESLNLYLTTNKYASSYKLAYYDEANILFPDELYYGKGSCSDDLKENIASLLIALTGSETNFATLLKTIKADDNIGSSVSAAAVYTAYATAESSRNDAQKAIVAAFDKILAVFTEAMNERVFPAEFLTSIFSGTLPTIDFNTIFTKDVKNLKLEEKLALHALIKFSQGMGARDFGMHPAPSSMEIKLNSVKKAHSSKFAANGAVLNVVIDTAADINEGLGALVESLIDTLLFNNRSFLAKLTDFIRSIFNIIEKLSINI